MRALRVVTIGLGILALLLCATGVAGAVLLAPSRDTARLGGISLRGAGAPARIPLLGLACADDAARARVETCTATVAGRPLRVTIEYAARSDQGFAACGATWDGATVACLRAVGWSRYAVIDADALGLTAADLRATARFWPTEGWRQADWQRLPYLLAGLAALGVALLFLNIPTSHPFGRVALAGCGALTAFFSALVPLGLLIASLGVID